MGSSVRTITVVLLLIFTPFSFQQDDYAEYRIINRKPNRIRDQLILPRSPCPDSFCPVDDSYPLEMISSVITKHSAALEQLYQNLYPHPVEDLILKENITDSYRLKGNFVCETDVVWLKLGWARDLSGRQLVIINTSRFPQVHRLEVCRYADKRCEYLPPCYKSKCQQRFVHQHLIAIDPGQVGNGPFVELFPLPSSCSCFVDNFTYF